MDFETLVETHAGMLWRIALSHERDRDRAEDLYQDICVALWRSLAAIRDADDERAFVARIANNRAISYVRSELRQPVAAADADVDDTRHAAPDRVAEALDVHKQQERLLKAVQELPLNWRLPVTLTLEGFKPAEIAYVMGETANTVSLRLKRAKDRLKVLLAREDNRND